MKVEPMRLLLIEDELADAIRYSDCAKLRSDIKFVGMTDSGEEGIKLVKSKLPEGVILDLQLVKGEGSGIRFLETLNDEDLTLRPIVVVTTSNQSDAVYKLVEMLGADFFFCKSRAEYNVDLVIDTLLSLRRTLDAKQKKKPIDISVQTDLGRARGMVESPDELRDRIYNRIDTELDLVGIRAKLKGRRYLREAIYVQIHSKKERGSGIEEVAAMFNFTYASIIKTMQTAIDDAWDNGDAEEIRQHFTARITAKTGVPYVSDFVHFYAEKIKNSI